MKIIHLFKATLSPRDSVKKRNNRKEREHIICTILFVKYKY